MHVIYKTPKQENLHYVDHTFYQGHVDAFLHADIHNYITSSIELEKYYIS